MKAIIFKEKNHEYLSDKIKFNSVSHIVGHFRDKFDDQFMGPYCALKENHPKILKKAKEKYLWSDPEIIRECTKDFDYLQLAELLRDADELRWQWSESSAYGTSIHLGQENLHYRRGWYRSPLTGVVYKVIEKPKKRGADNYFFLDKALAENKCNFMIPETLLQDLHTPSAGQMDCGCFYWTGRNHIWHNGDYKTDKKLSWDPIFVAKVFGGKSYPKTMHPPFQEIADSNLAYYTCKMSMYGLFMCKMGLLPGNQYIMAIPKIGKRRLVPLPFVPTVAQKMLNLYYGMDEHFGMDAARAYASMGRYDGAENIYDQIISEVVDKEERELLAQ